MVAAALHPDANTHGRPSGPLVHTQVLNWIGGRDEPAAAGEWLDKLNPATGAPFCQAARSRAEDVDRAVAAARAAQPAWGALPAVRRGEILLAVAMELHRRRLDVARVVAEETGKGPKAALGENDAATSLGVFMAGEGQRMYGRTTTSGTAGKHAMTVRHPLGVAGLIVAANTPIANVAWKVFPALICGNAVVLKAAEDAPATAKLFADIAHDAGLPAGVLNVLQGYGREAGEPLVSHAGVDVISFTGSTAVGRKIAVIAGRRLAKVSLELGGKNPFIVCDDADLAVAAKWVLLSAFSNAGQRCAAGSRVIIFDSIYDEFAALLTERAGQLKVGPGDDDDFGPVINERQLRNMLAVLDRARQEGARILTGGYRLEDETHRGGFYLAPTLVELRDQSGEISRTELFGPIGAMYRARDLDSALAMANDSMYGLTACIHTRNIHRAMHFVQHVQAGVAVVNGGTFGSEPHMPFGGVKDSGNGSREPGTEALDVYSNLKDIYINADPAAI